MFEMFGKFYDSFSFRKLRNTFIVSDIFFAFIVFIVLRNDSLLK